MTVERGLRLMAGVMVLLSVVLTYYVKMIEAALREGGGCDLEAR
jgi:hypothetical protein